MKTEAEYQEAIDREYKKLPHDYRGKYVKIKREYGPYLDGKPILKEGSTCEILAHNWSYGQKKATGFRVYHAGREYDIAEQDLEFIPE